MLDEVVRKPNPETSRLVSYGQNNTQDYKVIKPGVDYEKKIENFGPLGKQVQYTGGY